MADKVIMKKPGGLSIISFIGGLVSGIGSIVTLLSLFTLYLGQHFNLYPYGTSEVWGFNNLMVFAVWWIYLIVWIAIILVPIPVLAAIICGSIDLARNKAGLANRKGRKLDVAGILLGLSPFIVIGIFFIPSVSEHISKIPG